MTMKKLMIPFLEADAGARAFEAGAVFAREFKAHLDIVHMRQQIIPSLTGNIYHPVATTYTKENLEILKEAADSAAADLKKQFQGLCADQSVSILEKADHTDDKGVTAAWHDVEKNLPFDLARRARIADMTVFARSSDHAPGYTMNLIEEVIFQSGQPALVVGKDRAIDEFPKTVIVAWDGGREAARAISAALPVLKRAEMVVVTAIGELAWGVEPPESVAAFLKLHGVHAVCMHSVLDKHGEAEEVFLGRVKSKEADLVVMGAYSHNRFREMILGGFTRFMLRHSDIPLLMAH